MTMDGAAGDAPPDRRFWRDYHSSVQDCLLPYSNAEALRHNLGAMSNCCPHCHARSWAGETINCCFEGSLIIPEPTIPISLSNLIYSAPVRQNIRSYNMAMAMASVGHKNKSLPDGTFVMGGKSYHRVGSLQPQPGQDFNFAQIYILDTMDATARRSCIFKDRLDSTILNALDIQLRRHNALVSDFCRASNGNVPELVWSSDDDIINMQIGAIVSTPGRQRSIIIQRQAIGKLEFIPDGHSLYHSLAYPLLFPTGNHGWHWGMHRFDHESSKFLKVSLIDYGRHLLMHRDVPSHIQRCERLGLEFYCDAWAQQEARSASFHALPDQQARYRVGKKCAVEDQLSSAGNINDVSIPMILPSSFVGSSKWYHMLYLDAMALPQRLHAPDLFITFTCNPHWPEISSAIPANSHWRFHPDIVARVFYLKFKSMMSDIVQDEIFGAVAGYVWRIEWQARGLPHVHLLIILVNPLQSVSQIDAIISAEIPDPDAFPVLHGLVQDFHIHTPCDRNIDAGCRQQNAQHSCKRYFPKDMSPVTIIRSNKFPMYRRRGQFTCSVGGRVISDDWVVSFSPFLLLRYGAHCNVEVAASLKSFKYVYKYVLKSPDHAAISINEIDAHLSGRLLSCSEAVWRFLGLPLHKEFPAVTRLHLHLPNEHSVIFDPTEADDDVANAILNSTSSLLEWFALNIRDAYARSLLYEHIPEHYSWNKAKKCWSARIQGTPAIGRILAVSNKNVELFSLRRLLRVVKGATGWVDLYTVDGHCYPTFHDACGARGMLNDDADVIAAMTFMTATCCHRPSMLREFAMLLINRTVQNAVGLFHMFAENLCEDGEVNASTCASALQAIELIMADHGRSLTDSDYGFSLPENENHDHDLTAAVLRRHTFGYAECIEKRDDIVNRFTSEQQGAMETILASVHSGGPNVFCVLAAAGCGKSWFVNGLTWHLRSEGKIVLNVAASALAATLLLSGQTAHSTFKLPIPATDTSWCNFKAADRELLRQCALICYDEVSMVSPEIGDMIDRSLRELMGNNMPFGGKCIVFLGDFKQLLPVVPGRKGVTTIKNALWWQYCQIIRFTINFRAIRNPAFCAFLEDVGNGRMHSVQVPSSSKACDATQLIEKVYGSDLLSASAGLSMIIAPDLNSCARINEQCLAIIAGDALDASAFDDDADNTNPNCYTADYISSLKLSGVPPAVLSLKVGARYMVIRNYDVQSGICNGSLCCLMEMNRQDD